MTDTSDSRQASPPLLANKAYQAPSVFRPENLLREARRQKALPVSPVPAICVLDPDGDIARTLMSTGDGRPDRRRACYHTSLYRFHRDGVEFGIIGALSGRHSPCWLPRNCSPAVAGC